MKGKQLDSKIRNLVAQGKLWEAITTGLYHYPRSNFMIHLAGRYKDLERQNNYGVLYSDQYQVERNKLSLALISTLPEIQPEQEYMRKPRRRIALFWILFITPLLDLTKLYAIGAAVSGCIATILITTLPLLQSPEFQLLQPGILVNLYIPGLEDDGGSSVNTLTASQLNADKRNVQRQDDPNEIALREEQRKREAELEAQRKKAEAEAKKRAEEEARRRAEADKLKNDIGGLFIDGDPNASSLEGISTGTGKVGGGLGSRGVLKSPPVSQNSQKAGTVVVSVCVDSNGKVTSADFTQRGSTTADSQLVNAAIRNAKNWQFSEGAVDKQCGTISYNFKVR
jgi:TonB family protein